MDIRKTVLMAIGGTVVLVVAVLIWRLDPVQETLRPQKFWTSRVSLIELDVDYLRDKVAECTITSRNLKTGSPVADRVETVTKLCGSYDDDLKAAVESLLAAKKKLKEAKG